MLAVLLLITIALFMIFNKDLPPDFIAVLVMSALAVFFVKMLQVLAEAEKDSKNKVEKKCPPHKWATDPNGSYYCTECKNTPNYVPRDQYDIKR